MSKTPTIVRVCLLTSALVFLGAGCISLNPTASKNVATSGAAGIFVTTDKGDNWQSIAALPQADGVKNISSVNVYRVFDDPQDSNTMYLATRDQGLFYTYDSGKTWQRPAEPTLQTGFIYGVAVHPKDKCTLFVTNGIQLMKSTDCSRTWKEVYRESRSGIIMQTVRFEYFDPYHVYIGEGNGDILTSLDSGVSWTIQNRTGVQIVNIETDPYNKNVMYITTRSQGLYRSRDGGQTWESLQKTMDAFPGSAENRGFIIHPTKANVLYWLSTYGILYSTNGGDTWADIKLITPPGSVNIYAFAINPHNNQEMYYTATLKDFSRSTFYRSIDGGKSWTTKKLPSGQVPIVLKPHLTQDLLYMGFAIPPKQ